MNGVMLVRAADIKESNNIILDGKIHNVVHVLEIDDRVDIEIYSGNVYVFSSETILEVVK